MNTTKVTSGIVFNNCRFTEPSPLPTAPSLLASLAKYEGVYVVLTDDPAWSPRLFRPLYFGEAENMMTRATTSHEKYPSWKQAAGWRRLYCAFYALSGSSQRQRQAVESSLIAAYNTPCNEKLSFNLLRFGTGK